MIAQTPVIRSAAQGQHDEFWRHAVLLLDTQNLPVDARSVKAEIDACDSGHTTALLKILLQMSLVLTHGTRKRIIRVGRFAGQYAKPRSSPTEVRLLPDGSRVELQIDNLPTHESIDAWMRSGDFAKNPIGVVFDAEELLDRYRAGEPFETLVARPPLPEGKTPFDMLRF